MSSYSTLDDEDFWRRVDDILGTIPHEPNRGVVRRYIKERLAHGVKTSTLANDANAIRGFCLHMKDKPLEATTKADVVDYVTNAFTVRTWKSVKKSGEETVTKKKVRISQGTLSIRKVIIRDFFRWLRGTDDYPAEVKGLEIGRPSAGEIPTDELIDRQDLLRLIQAWPDARRKAILAVLAEAGLRAGELCALNIRSVVFDQYGAVLILPKNGKGLKTGSRRVRLFESSPYLHAWYEAHPQKDDPRAPLFFTESLRAPRARMTATALWDFCVSSGELAGLKKHTNPHLFRHSAATERARQGWNEAQMRAYFGWSKNSDMPSRYVHLAGLDYEDIELERRGLKSRGDRASPSWPPLVCRVCKAQNVATATFCTACRNPVSPAAEAELEARREAEVKEAATRLLADTMKESITAEVQKALAAAGLAKT